MAQEPFYKRAFALLRMYISFLIFIGPTFLYRHRMGVLLPLAEQVRSLPRPSQPSLTSTVLRLPPHRDRRQANRSRRLLPRRISLDQTRLQGFHRRRRRRDCPSWSPHGRRFQGDQQAFRAGLRRRCLLSHWSWGRSSSLRAEDFTFDSLKPTALKSLDAKKAAGLAIAVYEHPGTVHGAFPLSLLPRCALTMFE